MRKLLLVASACVLALGLVGANANADIILTPTMWTTGVTLVATGISNGNPNIEGMYGVELLYKQNYNSLEEGPSAGAYTTTLLPLGDPSRGTVTWVGPNYITANPIYLLVKDGSPRPWYLYNINMWDGKETIRFRGFYPAQGAISHVSIYGTPVPDGGTTLVLLGGALLGLETLRRRFTA